MTHSPRQYSVRNALTSLRTGLLLLAAVWPAPRAADLSPPAPRHGGTLRLAGEIDVRTWDPLNCNLNHEMILASLLYSTLVDYDEGGKLVPVLLESLPAVSPDGLNYTFKLRPGVRFSNGRNLAAEDAVFSLRRQFDYGTGAADCYLRNIRGQAAYSAARAKEATSAAPRTTPEASRGWSLPRSKGSARWTR